MRYPLHLILLLLGCFLSDLQAQPYTEEWDVTISDYAAHEQLHHLYQAGNGHLYAAGELRSTSYDQDGVLLQLNPATGQAIRHIPFPLPGDDGLKGMAAGPSGGLWVAGYAWDERLEEQVPRLLELDYRLQAVDDHQFNDYSGEGFTHVAAYATGGLLLAGQRMLKREVETNFYFFKQKKLQSAGSLKNWQERIGEVIAILPSPRGDVLYVVANARRSRNSKDGTVFILAVEEGSNEVRSAHSAEGEFNYARAATLNEKGDILLTGDTYRAAGQADLWVAQFSVEKWQMSTLETEEEQDHVGGWGIVHAPAGHQMVLQERSSTLSGARFMEYQMMRGSKALKFVPFGELQRSGGFAPQAMIMTFAGRVIIGGNQEQDRNNTQIRLQSYAPMGGITSKGRIEVSCTQPRLLFDNGDQVLSPGEKLDIAFEVKNVGTEDIWNGQVMVKPVSLAGGIELPWSEVFIGALGQNTARTVKVPLLATGSLQSGQSEISLEIMAGNQLLDRLQLSLRSSTTTRAGRVQVRFVEVDLQGTRSFDSNTNTKTIQVQTFSDQPLERSKFQMTRNGKAIQDSSKDRESLFRPANEGEWQGGQFSQIFTIEVPLEEGQNKIELQVEGYGDPIQVDPIFINFRPRRPRLHVLAIAPNYTDFLDKGYTPLRYNDNDARDLAALLAEQEKSGLYSKVFVDTLITAEQTKLQSIQYAFNDLVNRTRTETDDRFIAEEDVVLIFISGHGDVLDDEEFVIIPSDYDPQNNLSTVLDYESGVLRYLRRIERKTLLFVDACHSGVRETINRGTVEDSITSTALFRLNQAAPGILAFQSCREKESSYENIAWENGAFTEALLEALRGRQLTLEGGADSLQSDGNEDGFLSIKELMDYTGRRVPLLLQEVGLSYPQHPQATNVTDRQRFDNRLDFFRVLK